MPSASPCPRSQRRTASAARLSSAPRNREDQADAPRSTAAPEGEIVRLQPNNSGPSRPSRSISIGLTFTPPHSRPYRTESGVSPVEARGPDTRGGGWGFQHQLSAPTGENPSTFETLGHAGQHSAPSQPRIQHVPQRVPEHVEAEDGAADR